jgi:hypothetical protein
VVIAIGRPERREGLLGARHRPLCAVVRAASWRRNDRALRVRRSRRSEPDRRPKAYAAPVLCARLDRKRGCASIGPDARTFTICDTPRPPGCCRRASSRRSPADILGQSAATPIADIRALHLRDEPTGCPTCSVKGASDWGPVGSTLGSSTRQNDLQLLISRAYHLEVKQSPRLMRYQAAPLPDARFVFAQLRQSSCRSTPHPTCRALTDAEKPPHRSRTMSCAIASGLPVTLFRLHALLKPSSKILIENL